MKKFLMFFALFAALIFVVGCGSGSSENDDETDVMTGSADDDSGTTQDDGDTVNENPENLPECSPASATPCFDPETDLIWSGKSAEQMSWDDAVTYCINLNEGGYGDWRLPNLEVLRTLVQNCDNSYNSYYGCDGGSDGKYSKFGDIVFLWSSSGGSPAGGTAQGVYFFDGSTQWEMTRENFDVRCVRNLKCDMNLFSLTAKKCVNPCDSKPCDLSPTIVNGTCVPYDYKKYSCGGKDPSSGLTWSAESPGSFGWYSAEAYCDNLTESGYSDWRMPTISELRTLVQNCPETQMPGGSCGVTDDCLTGYYLDNNECRNDACKGCADDENYTGKYSKFGDTYSLWSSSAASDNSNEKWIIDFDSGALVCWHVETYYNVRCVR